MLVLKGIVGLHRTVQLQLLQLTGQGIDLDYCDTEWFALEMDRYHSVIFEIASKYCILDSFVDQCQTLFLGAPKSLQMVIAAMKLKDVYSLEEKL